MYPYICILYASPCAPLLVLWPGEVEGTSLAMAQGKASPVPAPEPMFRVSPVLRRYDADVPLTAVGADFRTRPFDNCPRFVPASLMLDATPSRLSCRCTPHRAVAAKICVCGWIDGSDAVGSGWVRCSRVDAGWVAQADERHNEQQ